MKMVVRVVGMVKVVDGMPHYQNPCLLFFLKNIAQVGPLSFKLSWSESSLSLSLHKSSIIIGVVKK